MPKQKHYCQRLLKVAQLAQNRRNGENFLNLITLVLMNETLVKHPGLPTFETKRQLAKKYQLILANIH